MTFKHELGDKVQITISGEKGEVIGRAEYKAQSPQYFILFKAADGRAITTWWEADYLSAA